MSDELLPAVSATESEKFPQGPSMKFYTASFGHTNFQNSVERKQAGNKFFDFEIHKIE